jgi:ATP-binding cassette subfamily B protein
MRYVVQLIRFTARYYWSCVALATVLYCVLPLALGFETSAFFDSFTVGSRFDALTIVALIAALELAAAGTEVAVTYAWSGFSYLAHVLLQRNMFAGVLSGYAQRGLPVASGDAIARFREDPPAITSGSMDGLCDLIGRGIFALVAALVMWRIDPLLTAAAFAPVIVAATVSDALGTRASTYGAAALESTTDLTRFLGELVGAQLAVRVAGAESRVVERLADLGETRRQVSVRDRVFSEIVNSMNFHLVHISTGAVLLLGAGRIRSGAFTVGDFALFVVFLDQLTFLPAEIGRVLTELKRTRVSIDRMHALMPDQPRERVVAASHVYVKGTLPEVDPLPAPVPLARLDVEGLTYCYPGSGRGVVDASFVVERGGITVVTGRVGGGKTTLLHCLLGLLPRQAGETRWNGQTVDEPATFFVPPRVAFTPQVPRLFSETLRENIALGVAVDDAALHRAVHDAALEPDLARFECQLDTLVGPRGVKLSGGQIQRAAAARMFVRTPDLLVFDDLSSALDVATEALLWQRLFARRGDVTCLVVSHSPIALACADQILHCDEGTIRRVTR